jgi:hypothetical protein
LGGLSAATACAALALSVGAALPGWPSAAGGGLEQAASRPSSANAATGRSAVGVSLDIWYFPWVRIA